MCFVDANKDSVILGPSINPNPAPGDGKCDMLKPTLLEPSIFYRTSRTLLNRRFLISREEERAFETSLRIADLENEGRTVFSLQMEFCNYHYIVQDGIAYIVAFRSNRCVYNRMFAFTADGSPTVVDDHPLKHIQVRGIDRTPCDNHFLIEQNGEYFTCSVENGEKKSVPLPFELPVHNYYIEFAYIEGIAIPRTIDHILPCVICDKWDFVSLNGDVHCSEYKEESGVTNFYPMGVKDVSYAFIVDKSMSPFSVKFPIIFNTFHNSITLLQSSPEYRDHVLHDSRRIYDAETKKWNIGFITTDLHSCHMYVGNRRVSSFEKPRAVQYSNISFSNHHFAASWAAENVAYVLVNDDELFSSTNVRELKVVGDYIWYLSNGTLTVHVLDRESGGVIRTMRHIFEGRCDDLMENPYCGEECLVLNGKQTFFIRCSTENLFH
ncbi:hypothetical protein PCE1_003888 [Barthelona sp. PCE]